jgi:ferredoxin like protein
METGKGGEEDDEDMNDRTGVKTKLGLNVFKEGSEFHIKIREGMGKDVRLKKAITLCPAGLYSENENGEVVISVDGCLECGTCLIACGPDLLDWHYPAGGSGVQFRFG